MHWITSTRNSIVEIRRFFDRVTSTLDFFEDIFYTYGPLARYVLFRLAHAPGMSGTCPPPLRVSDPDMHQGTCVTHVPWCMPGSLTIGFFAVGGRENVPGIPGACVIRNFTYLVRGPLMRALTPAGMEWHHVRGKLLLHWAVLCFN